MRKKSSIEVLFKEVLVDHTSISISPSECPGKGRVKDLVYDDSNVPACIYDNVVCPYFDRLYIDSSLRNKTIFCTVVKLNEIKEE